MLALDINADKISSESIGPLKAFLAAGLNLEYLDLQFGEVPFDGGCADNEPDFDVGAKTALVELLEGLKLKKLVLCHPSFCVRSYKELLGTQKSSLQRLELLSSMVPSFERQHTILEWIADSLDLYSIRLSEPQQGDKLLVYSANTASPTDHYKAHDYIGTDNVREGLKTWSSRRYLVRKTVGDIFD